MLVGGEIFQARGWLRRTPDDFRNALLARCQPRTFQAGETIYRIGDPPTGLYGVVSGSVGFEVAPAERDSGLLFVGGPGSWFGFSSVVTRDPRIATMVAREPSALVFLPASAVVEIIREDPDRWRHFARIGIGEVKKATMFCDDLMRRDHVGRVMAILLHLGNCRQASERDSEGVQITLTQDELARVANVGRTVAGAVLRRLEADGVIKLAYRHVHIVSPATVRARLSPLHRGRLPFDAVDAAGAPLVANRAASLSGEKTAMSSRDDATRLARDWD